MKTCSAEFEDTAEDLPRLLQTLADLIVARRQFAVTPRFDSGPQGLRLTSGFLLSWPSTPDPVAPPAPTPEPTAA